MSKAEYSYLHLLRELINVEEESEDRTGTGTYSLFGRSIRADLSEGFPLLTTKKVSFKNVALELLFFLRGETNNNWLKERGCNIWTPWERADGDLGPVYGKQWTSWNAWKEKHLVGIPNYTAMIHTEKKIVNQVQGLIDEAKINPSSRRLLVSAWNPAELDSMVLPPCHYSWQIYIRNGKLSLLWNQRSADVPIGVPYNLASYSLLCHMLAHVLGYEVGEVIGNFGDAHVYKNQLGGVVEQIIRDPRPLPTLKINRKVDSIFDFQLEDFSIEGYDPHPAIKMPVAV